MRSIAYQLHARGLTQRQIAEKLGVGKSTVGEWLAAFGDMPEPATAPALPDQATLDRIAAAIKDQAKADASLSRGVQAGCLRRAAWRGGKPLSTARMVENTVSTSWRTFWS